MKKQHKKQKWNNRINKKRNLPIVEPICTRCGEPGKHWVGGLQFGFFEPDGFWSCPNLYGLNGKRITSDSSTPFECIHSKDLDIIVRILISLENL